LLSGAEQEHALLQFTVRGDPARLPADTDWDSWLWNARMERVVPVLYHLVNRSPDVAADVREQVRQVQGAVMGRCVQLEHHLVGLSRLLASHGIRSAVLKGGATAHLDYPDATWREFSDIDLLIDSVNLRAARALVEAEGWRQGYPLPRGHERLTHAVTFTLDRMELDLHQRVAHRALGLLIPASELLERAAPFQIGNAQVAALDAVDRVIHAAVHTATAGPNVRLSSLADVLVLTDRHADKALEVLDRADRWRVRSIVQRGIGKAYEAAALEAPHHWRLAERRPGQSRDRLIEFCFAGPHRRPAAEEVAYLRLMDRWSDRVRYLVGHIAPGRDFSNVHGGTGLGGRTRYLRNKLRA